MTSSTSANGAYKVLPSFTDGTASTGPFLLPPGASTNSPVSFKALYLYAGSTGNVPSITVSAGPDFSLTFQAPNPTVVFVVVTLGGSPATNLWKCDAASRAELMQNFVVFRDQVESQLENQGLIVSGGAAGSRLVAETMPAPIGETPFYNFGLVTGFAASTFPRVDLVAGMRLRVEYQGFQFPGIGSSFSGYVASEQSVYQLQAVLGPDGVRRLAFDPFLGSIAGPTIPQPSSVPPSVASGLIDLQRANVGHAYWRVLYPQTMIAGNAQGDVGSVKNAVLLGADTLSDLEAATASTTPVAGTTTFVFLGRATVVPEFLVALTVLWQTTGTSSQQLLYVPVGTTVAHLLERFTGWLPLGPPNAPPPAVSLTRLQAASTNNLAVSTTLVNFPPSGCVAAYDLPLAGGDSVTLAF